MTMQMQVMPEMALKYSMKRYIQNAINYGGP